MPVRVGQHVVPETDTWDTSGHPRQLRPRLESIPIALHHVVGTQTESKMRPATARSR